MISPIHVYIEDLKENKKAQSYIKNRGIEDLEWLQEVFKVGSSQIKNDFFYGYIVVPIIYKNEITTMTSRAYNGAQPKIKNQPNKRVVVPLNYEIVETEDIFFITEGIMDTISLVYAGYPAISVLGTNTAHRLDLDLIKNKKVLIWMDNDEPGRKSKEALYERLNEHNTLYDIEIKDAKDANELLVKSGSIKGFRKIIEEHIKQPNKMSLAVKKKKKKKKKTIKYGTSSYPDIIDVISRYIPIHRQMGRNRWQTFCPFHPDRNTPSFIIYGDTQQYHCFGCGAHGNAISFIMNMHPGYRIKDALYIINHLTTPQ